MKHSVKYAVAVALGVIPLSGMATQTTVDVMVLHTPGLAARYANDATTRINHLENVANQIYADSGLDTRIRIVHDQQVAYPDSGNSYNALVALTNQSEAFSDVDALRETYGADMVTLMRPYASDHASCGIAWIGGSRNGDFTSNSVWKRYMASHVSATTCGDYVTAHELGHNMGLKHSRRQDGEAYTLPYALGHGVDGQFTTVMAYQSSFGVNYWTGKVYKFSSPSLSCNGLPCGVDRNDPVNGADAAYALSQTTPQIANFYATKVKEPNQPADQKSELELAKEALEQARADLISARSDLKADRSDYIQAYRAYLSANRAYVRMERYIQRWSRVADRYTARADRYASYATRLSGNRAKRYAMVAERYRQLSARLESIRDSYAERLPGLLAARDQAKEGYTSALADYQEAREAYSLARNHYYDARKAFYIARNESRTNNIG